MIPANEISQYIIYNPDTGIFTRAKTTGRRSQHKKGEIAGCRDQTGYLHIKINGKTYKGHRIAFAFMTGEWPPEDVDHINGVRSDDRWSNLRLANQSQNNWNSKKRSDCTSGFKGVWRHASGKWQSCVFKEKKRYHVGTFDTPEEAYSARVAKAKELHGEFARAA